MVSWFTESSLVPLIGGTLLALAFLGLAISYRNRVMFLVAIGVVAVTAGIVAIETWIVTDREAVVAGMWEVADAAKNDDVDAVLARVAKGHDVLRETVRYHMDMVRVENVWFQVDTFTISETDSPKTAEINMIVYGSGSYRDGMPGHAQVRVIVQLVKEADGKWRFTDYQIEHAQSGYKL